MKGKKPRAPFSADQLKAIFSAPVFTGCKGPRRRFDPGPYVLKDAFYWVPILGFYTGLRLGEIVQLHAEDIKLEGPVPHIEVTDANSGELGSGEEKHVKSDAGVRNVPLHPDLLTLPSPSAPLNARSSTAQGSLEAISDNFIPRQHRGTGALQSKGYRQGTWR